MIEIPKFEAFPKIKRLSREIIVTEKIDGTNASILITEDDQIVAGSRSRWISVKDDNFGFARWVEDNKEELRKLGYGHHFGEWWGKGIQRGYNQVEKKFSLFNTSKWTDSDVRPKCCDIVPVLYRGPFYTQSIEAILNDLEENGSVAAKGYPYPEGICIYHTQANWIMKKTIDKDDAHKYE